MSKGIDYSIRWHIKFQFEQLVEDIALRAADVREGDEETDADPATAKALDILANIVSIRAERIVL